MTENMLTGTLSHNQTKPQSGIIDNISPADVVGRSLLHIGVFLRTSAEGSQCSIPIVGHPP